MCPNKGKITKIAAAKRQTDDADWTVIECALKPTAKSIAVTCLLKEIDPSK